MDRIVIEHTSLQSNEDCFSSFLLSSLEDNEVMESLRKRRMAGTVRVFH